MRARTLLAGLLLVAAGSGTVPAQPERVQFEASLDRTALWSGELLEYRITLYHDPGVEILRDNLEPGSLQLDPFTLEGLEVDPGGTGERRVLRIVLRLSALGTEGGEAAIPPLSIYYATRRPGPLGRGTEIETHTLVIPERKVGLRSTLVSDSGDIRDSARIDASGPLASSLTLAGWVVLAACGLQAARRGVQRYRRAGQGTRKRDSQAVSRRAINELESLGAAPGGEAWPQQCQRMAGILRGAVDEVLEVDSAGLTPAELRHELLGREVSEPLADRIFQVLDECERVSFAGLPPGANEGGPGSLPASCREALAGLARV